MVTALEQADQEENRDGSHNMTQLMTHSRRDVKYAARKQGKVKDRKHTNTQLSLNSVSLQQI